MMATKYWIKLYHEVLDDPKMGRLPDNLWRRFIECCLLAGELNEDGKLPPVFDVAWRLRSETELIEAEFDQLARYGLLEYRADKVFDDHWFVPKFANRQSPMEKAEYMKRSRDQKYKDRYQSVTNSHADIDKDIDKDIDIGENTYQVLLTAFINHSQLPQFGNPKPRDNEALIKMVKAGCTADDIKNAVEYSTSHDLDIIGPASVSNGAIMSASKRKRQASVKKEIWSEEHY